MRYSKTLEQMQVESRERHKLDSIREKYPNYKPPSLATYIPLAQSADVIAEIAYWEDRAAKQKEERRLDSVIRKQEQRTKRPGFVYVVGCIELECYKIGVTCRETPTRRIDDIRRGVPFAIDFKRTWPCRDVYVIEARLHRHFAKWRAKGEWFKLNELVLAEVIEEARRLTTPRIDKVVNNASGTTVIQDDTTESGVPHVSQVIS